MEKAAVELRLSTSVMNRSLVTTVFTSGTVIASSQDSVIYD
jgi:hypothetical protein